MWGIEFRLRSGPEEWVRVGTVHDKKGQRAARGRAGRERQMKPETWPSQDTAERAALEMALHQPQIEFRVIEV
jgi:hypothetical protein